MLDSDNVALFPLADAVGQLPCDIELPPSWNDFFDHPESRPLREVPIEKRRYARRYLRAYAGLQYRQTAPVLRRPMMWHRVYMTNLSQGGILFLHAEQLFPLERMWMILPDPRVREFVPDPEDCIIEVVRCHRIQDHCFEIGARFVEGL
jgi:hypothetical protein